MKRDRKPPVQETDRSMAIASFLCSVLVLTVVCGTLWMLQLLVAGSGLLGSTLLSGMGRY